MQESSGWLLNDLLIAGGHSPLKYLFPYLSETRVPSRPGTKPQLKYPPQVHSLGSWLSDSWVISPLFSGPGKIVQKWTKCDKLSLHANLGLNYNLKKMRNLRRDMRYVEWDLMDICNYLPGDFSFFSGWKISKIIRELVILSCYVLQVGCVFLKQSVVEAKIANI